MHLRPLTGPIGFYPVVPDAAWVRRLLGWGVRTIQLRIKAADHDAEEIAWEVRTAIEAGREVPGAQVFINDHWQLALSTAPMACTWARKTWTRPTSPRCAMRAYAWA
jgi:thiamine monophosphate synthase